MLEGTTTILDMGTVHGHDVVMDARARAASERSAARR